MHANNEVGTIQPIEQKHANASRDFVVTMCGSTGRGEKASSILRSHGMSNVQVMKGGLKAWQEVGLPVESAGRDPV